MPTAVEILAFAGHFSLYFTISIFIIGSIGNCINLCVLTTLKVFRSNQCAFYLIVESIVNTCQLSILFTIDLLPVIYESKLENIFIAWCKLKPMLTQIFRLLSTSMVCFVALDQFLSTNPHFFIRKISTLKFAHRLTFVAICIWIIHTIPYGIFYQIVSSNVCMMISVELKYYYSFFYYPILHGLLPIFSSSLFSLFAYRNVRLLVRRQVSTTRRRLDRQLTAMVFVRVICFVSILLPYTIYRIYMLNVTTTSENLYQYAIEQLIFSIIASLTNLNYTISFYIFLASSPRYRRQVKHFFSKKCWRLLRTLCNSDKNEIHPLGPVSNVIGTDIE